MADVVKPVVVVQRGGRITRTGRSSNTNDHRHDLLHHYYYHHHHSGRGDWDNVNNSASVARRSSLLIWNSFSNEAGCVSRSSF